MNDPPPHDLTETDRTTIAALRQTIERDRAFRCGPRPVAEGDPREEGAAGAAERAAAGAEGVRGPVMRDKKRQRRKGPVHR